MPRRRITRARPLPAALLRLGGAQDGSFLVEAMVSALILVIVGLGVLKSLDRGSRLGGEQKVQAVAGNVAHAELERIRSLPVSEQSNMTDATRTVPVGGVTYSIRSRTEWINDKSGDAGCTTAGSKADYMKLSTVVSWPGMNDRKPVTLETLITPGVRSFAATQGSLAVHVADRSGNPLTGLQLGLSGGATLSDATNSAGCVLWGYLPAGTGYTVRFSRAPDYVLTDGQTSAVVPATVVGRQTSNLALQYDRGGYLRTKFVTKRTDAGGPIATDPTVAHVTNSGGGGVSVGFPVTNTGGTSGLLFPFTSAYTVHADSCAAAEVPVPPLKPSPDSPEPPSAVGATVTSGMTTTSADVYLPALNIRVRSLGAFKDKAKIRVTTPCGTILRRTTTSSGTIDDPGFPYAAMLSICISDGTRERVFEHSNTYFYVTPITYSLVSTDPSGTCA